jgi:hypothetical protein
MPLDGAMPVVIRPSCSGLDRAVKEGRPGPE